MVAEAELDDTEVGDELETIDVTNDDDGKDDGKDALDVDEDPVGTIED